VLAHQGGWDELLMVLVPILIFAALLVVANRRASRIGEQQSLAGDGASAAGVDGADGAGGGIDGASDGAGRGGDAGAERRRSDGRAGP
jgi:hypothetical protein